MTPYTILPKSHYLHTEHHDKSILRVVSINVNGLRAAEKKGFMHWLAQSEADVVCLQETRLTHEQWDDKFKLEGWFAHLFPAEKAGYAGTSIYSRLPFVSVKNGLGFDLADTQGRFVEAEFDLGIGYPIYIASLYLPSGSSGEEAQARKDLFLAQYQTILATWRKENKSVIVCGDYNIVHKRIDIKNWSGNQKSSGCLPHERAWLDSLYDELGYVDTFREVRQESDVYSWWSNRGQARAKNVGWRIDYQVCSPDWKDRTVNAWVYKAQWFSDHAPVVIDYVINPKQGE
ncbi:exodeoxyribonuclease III [Conservatibacter flavescens]|uniref:Exodeoxyribonuclease III n=1 Tax=Conservatibacter flavescens TaxID=28161 RepID=A0A2M8S5Q6_9PAST|nr:exodeoxyribonuclease III [Conservatibacter flavescens]PJG86470.1 exodeoxyribonuclease III [Conservatibacter flavescens]